MLSTKIVRYWCRVLTFRNTEGMHAKNRDERPKPSVIYDAFDSELNFEVKFAPSKLGETLDGTDQTLFQFTRPKN